MAKKSSKKIEDKNIVAVEEALSRTEHFIEDHQNTIMWVVGIIILVVAGYIGYSRFILSPREKEAKAEMFRAESYFGLGEYEVALEGDGVYPGFLDVVSDYRMTRAASLSHYYIGLIYLKQGEYDLAVNHLKRFRGRDNIIGAMAYGAIGDAYLEMEDKNQASRYYRKAYRYKPNNFSTPLFLFKAGLLFEEMGQHREALKLYTRIKNEYANSTEARNIDRYIARAGSMN